MGGRFQHSGEIITNGRYEKGHDIEIRPGRIRNCRGTSD